MTQYVIARELGLTVTGQAQSCPCQPSPLLKGKGRAMPVGLSHPQPASPGPAEGRALCYAQTPRILMGCSLRQVSDVMSGPCSETFLLDISTDQTDWWWQTMMWCSPANRRRTRFCSRHTRSFTDFWKGYVNSKFRCEKYVNWVFVKLNL